MSWQDPTRQDPGRRGPLGGPPPSPSPWRQVLVYFGLADDPRGPAASGDASGPADVMSRLEAIERRLAEQERTLEAIHDLLRRDADR